MVLARYVLVALLLLPLAELIAFVAVASTIGFLKACLLLLATSVFGLLILRGEGLARVVRTGLDRGRRFSAVELHAANFAVLLGGALLVVPGFITDALGVALLLAPRTISRAVLRRILAAFERRRPQPQVVDLERDQWRDMPDRPIEDRRDRAPPEP